MAKSNLAEATPPAKVPIVDYLVLPEKGEPWLLGNRCPRCGTTFLGSRIACSNCSYSGSFEEVQLSKKGKLYVFSVVYQSLPQIKTPYVTCVVDLPEGVSVRGALREVEPDPAAIEFDMEVEMFFEAAGVNNEGSQVISFYFRPADKKKRVKRRPIMRSPEELKAMAAARAAKAGKKPARKAKKAAKKKAAKKSPKKKVSKKKTAKKGVKKTPRKAAGKKTPKKSSKKKAAKKVTRKKVTQKKTAKKAVKKTAKKAARKSAKRAPKKKTAKKTRKKR